MKKGILSICASALGFSLMAMFVRLADDCGYPLPAIQKAFFRNLVAVGIAAFVFFGNSAGQPSFVGRLPHSARDWFGIVLRSLFGTVGIFLNFYAISHAPLGDAMALNKTAPFWTLAASWLILGERIRHWQIAALVVAFSGALLVIKPGGSIGDVGWIGLASGVCAGVAYAILHGLGKRGVNGAFIILFFSAFSCLASVPFMVFDYHPMNAMQLACLAGAGAGAAIGQFGITWAYRYAEPRQVAVYDYTGIIFSSLLGFLVFAQIPDVLTLVGFVVIILAAVFVFRCKR